MGRKRNVYFYSGIEHAEDGTIKNWTGKRWSEFLDSLYGHSETIPVRGFDLTGTCDECVRPALRYLHFTRARALSDWPESGDFSGNVENLAQRRRQAGINSILEYSYLLPVSGTRYVAVVRSSGGPRSTAIGDWIALQKNFALVGVDFELVPVLSEDAYEKLNSAVGVKSIDIRYEGVPDGIDSKSEIERAVAIAGTALGERDSVNASIELSISLGNCKVTGPATDGIQRQLHRLAPSVNLVKSKKDAPLGSVSRLRAMTIQSRDDGTFYSEPVDFIKEQITIQADFGDDPEVAMDPGKILDGMLDAIRKFRERRCDAR